MRLSELLKALLATSVWTGAWDLNVRLSLFLTGASRPFNILDISLVACLTVLLTHLMTRSSGMRRQNMNWSHVLIDQQLRWTRKMSFL